MPGEALHERATELDFLHLLRKIVVAQDQQTGIIVEVPGLPDSRVDLLFSRDGVLHVVEAKRRPPQTLSRIDATCDLLLNVSSAFEKAGYKVRPILAVAGEYATSRLDLLHSRGVTVWDSKRILHDADAVGLGAEARNVLAGAASPFRPVHADELRSGLLSIPPGRAYWSLYQRHCSEIFEFLFRPSLETPYLESSNEAKVNRRDFIMANYCSAGFWQFMRDRYRADHVVVETKNLATPANKNHVLQLCNYLTFHGLGLFGVLVSRRGENAGARYTRREQWVLHNKMTIVFDDGDLTQMLEDKKAGGDPSVLVRQKIEDFRRSI